MSDYGAYDEGPRRYRTQRTRPRGREDPDYIEETVFVERGKGPPPRDLVYRGRDREDDVEDVQRDFPPPQGRRARGYRDDYDYDQRSAAPRARSVAGRRGYDDDDNYSQYGAAAGGAAAGYAAGRSRGGRDDRDYGRRQERRDYYSDDQSPPRRRQEQKPKSGIEGMLEGLGLGGVAGALTGGGNRDQGGRSRRGSRDRDGGRDQKREWAQAAQAALIAGAVEAFRSRGEPGNYWSGDKGKRIATAAISAGGIDKLIDRDPNDKSKRHLAEAVIGGIAATRLANGSRENPNGEGGSTRGRSRSRSVMDRFRSKSRAGSDSDDDRGRGGDSGMGGLKDLAAGGALAAVAKQVFDSVRSKSRGPARRSPSASSDDSYVPSRTRRRDRDVGQHSPSRGPPNDENAVARRGAGGGGGERQIARSGENRDRDSSTDSYSTTDIEEKRKKTRKKEFITAGLASIATIHAAHGVYQSMESSEKRHKLVAEGEMSPEEARKKRSKAWLQDAAAVGIAALGIKGAYSEWKEMNEQRHSMKELEERRRKRQKRRDRRMKEQKGGGSGGGGRRDRDDDDDDDDRMYMSGGGGRGGGGPSYPYSSGNIPPPPMGPPYR